MPNKLNTLSFQKAQHFLATEARKLEQRLFAFHFNGAESAREQVIEALRQYQNPDGGFGKALEPDVRMQNSSVVATKFALQILIDIEAPGDEALVREGLAYLLAAYESEKRVWPLVPDTVMAAPHAPWWNVAGLEQEFGAYLANPKAGVLRCLLEYREYVSDALIREVTDTVIAHFNHLPVAMPFFDAISFLLLFQAKNLGKPHQDTLLPKLEQTAQALVSENPDEWSGFAIKPLWLSPAPHAPLARVLSNVVQRNLDYEIEHQNADGSWSPTWSWGGTYPESWKVAEREWKGILTLAMLRTLRDYGRIEGIEPGLFGYKYHLD